MLITIILIILFIFNFKTKFVDFSYVAAYVGSIQLVSSLYPQLLWLLTGQSLITILFLSADHRSAPQTWAAEGEAESSAWCSTHESEDEEDEEEQAGARGWRRGCVAEY